MTFHNKFNSLYFPPHNFGKYEEILRTAKETGYTLISLEQFVEGKYREPYMILRHDIDTDPHAALCFAELEAKYNAGASYFFRLSTWNNKVIQTLYRRGFEVGYHYEESTSFAKRHHIRDREILQTHFPEIRDEFKRNLDSLRERSGLALEAIASHGDFSSPILDIGNDEAVLDPELRQICKIRYEAYDARIWDSYKNHLSDDRFPPYFKPVNPLEMISRKESFLFLSHPRWWRNSFSSSFLSDLRVLWQKVWW